MSVSHPNNGIEIDHGDGDLSAAVYEGALEIAIGEDFTGRHRPDKPQGYARYLEFKLTFEEAVALRDWLSSVLE